MATRNNPIFLTGKDVKEIIPKSIFPLLYKSQEKPTKNWYQIIDGNMLRFDTETILSLFFPNGIDCRNIWNKAAITYDANSQIICSNISKYVSHSNIVFKNVKSCNEEPILVIGWMYRQDIKLIKNNL